MTTLLHLIYIPYKAYTVPTYHIGLGHEWQVVPVLLGVQLRQRSRGNRRCPTHIPIEALLGGACGDGGAALLFTCVPTSTSLLYWHPLLILVPRESNNQASAGKQLKLTHQKRQRVYISSPKSLRSTFTSSQPAIKQSRTTTNRRDPLWFPFRPKS